MATKFDTKSDITRPI